MLKQIRVKNFAIIDTLEVSFGPGLNVMTGETGAGKSIIVGALGLVLGQRGYTEMIKTGKNEASVEAEFEITGHPVLKRLEIPDEDGILIRRTIARGGKGRAYINDTLVSIQALSELGRTLVDVHGQHEHQSLLAAENQMDLIDQYGRLLDRRAEVASLYAEAESLRRRIEALKQDARQRAQRVDMLSHQTREIGGAGLTLGEDVRLEEEVGILSNLSRLKELVEASYAMLYGEEGAALEKIASALDNLREMSSIDPDTGATASSLEEAHTLLEEAARAVRDLRARYELDPARLDEAQERLESIGKLKKKYGPTIEEVLRFRDEAEQQLKDLENADETAQHMEGELKVKQEALQAAAAKLSAARKKAAREIESAVMGVLKGLAFERAEFVVSIKPLLQAGPTGMDAVEFLFSANKGEEPKPLARVASGGELSRIMLAIKAVLREVDDIPVLVFDEVDAGIGGKTARAVAERLRESAEGRQVLCITHLPQIASAADAHYMIEKSTGSKGVSVEVVELSGPRRQEEIARMLSGSVTETSLKHAREMLAKATGK